MLVADGTLTSNGPLRQFLINTAFWIILCQIPRLLLYYKYMLKQTDWFVTTMLSQEGNGWSPPPHSFLEACYLQLAFPKMKLNLRGKIRNNVLKIHQNSQQVWTRIMKKELTICFQYCKTDGQYINSIAVLWSHDAKYGHLHKSLFKRTFL